MRKRLYIILISTIGVFITVCGILYIKSPDILANILSSATGTPVSVENIKWESHQFNIYGLRIDNPKKAKHPVALEAEVISINASYIHYLQNPITIDSIELKNVHVNIQLYNSKQTKGNWQTIMSNMAIPNDSVFSVERKSLIKKLIIKNISITLILSDGTVQKISPIAHLEFQNIESEKGIPTKEISNIIIQKALPSIFLKSGIKFFIEGPLDILKSLLPFI